MNVEKLELQRKAVNRKKWVLIVLFVVLWLPIAYAIQKNFNLPHRTIRYLGIPLMLLFYQIYTKEKRKFMVAFSAEISDGLLMKMHPSWKRCSEIGLAPQEVFDTLLIIKRKFVNTSNLIIGSMGEVDFQFCHIETSRSNILAARVPQIEFRGYFFVFDFPKFNTKPLHVHPQILKDFGEYLKVPQRVKTDSSEFEKAYITYSEDPIEARYILSLGLMARMIDLQMLLPGNVSYCFMNGKVYIALKLIGDTIEPKINRPLDIEKIEIIHEKTFELVESFVQELNLQMSIWKEKEA